MQSFQKMSKFARLLHKNSSGLLQMTSKRFLFTEDFLAISIMKEKQNLILHELKEQKVQVEEFRDKLLNPRQVTDDKSPKNNVILHDDISKLIMTSHSKENFAATANFLQNYVKSLRPEEMTPLRQARLLKLLKNYAGLSHGKKCMENVEKLLHDQSFAEKIGLINDESGDLNSNVPVIYNIFLDSYYEGGKYGKVLSEYDRVSEKIKRVPWPLVSLAMFSCLKLNTKESVEKASQIYNKQCSNFVQKSGFVSHPYALLLCQQGQLEEAYEVISNAFSKSMIRTQLKLFILTKLNRLTDAVAVLEHLATQASQEDSPLMKSGDKQIIRYNHFNLLKYS